MLVEFIFLAVMARLAAGKDLTFKVQNTPRNKFAFQSSSQNSLNPIESTQRTLNFLRNLRKNCVKSAKNAGQVSLQMLTWVNYQAANFGKLTSVGGLLSEHLKTHSGEVCKIREF